MADVHEQYEAYPYPERKPADEKKRLILGSPSHPLEIDHFLFGGRRDWSQPLRALVAGGGTGDGLIQLGTLMAQAGRPCEITYVDLSTASRKIAEKRAQIRGLSTIRFVTGSLLDAADLGQFDYIGCCGVLHHLPDPDAGFQALRQALAPGGGLGFMVYAPYGRSGIYPLQEAFAALFEGLSPQERLREGRRLFAALPDGHPFKCNPNLGDHQDSDAGFYDLLLHSQDRAFRINELGETLTRTGWTLAGMTMPALYDLSRITPKAPEHLGSWEAMAIAERLRGTIKTHVGYAVAQEGARAQKGSSSARIPHLKGVDPMALARAIDQGQSPRLNFGGLSTTISLPRACAPLIAGVNGRQTLAQIAQGAGVDPIAATTLWAKVERELEDWGMLLYSSFLV